jgi:glucokinase
LSRLLLGIDIGGTKIALALGDREGRILARRRRATAPTGDPDRDVEAILADARQLLAEIGVAARDVAMAGLSAPGPLDHAGGRVLGPPNLPGWHDVPLVRLVGEALGIPAHLENDADAAALAEWRFGAGRGRRDLVYLTMSTGVGGGLILDGTLHRGAGGRAGEVGHMPVEWDGAPCACGLRGCLEAYVGGRAWTARLRDMAPEASRAVRLAGGRTKLLPEHVVAAAGEGDPFARAEMQRFVDYLARGIVALAFVLAPQLVVLGTIPTAAGESLCLAPLRRAVASRLWPAIASDLQILPAALGEEGPYLAGLSAASQGLSGGASIGNLRRRSVAERA